MADIPAIPSPPPLPQGESGIDDNNSKTLSPKRDHGHSAHLRPKSKSRSRSRSCSSQSHQTRSRSRSHSRSPRVRSRSRSRSPRRNKHHHSHSHTRRHRSRDHDRESHSISGRRHPSSHHSHHSYHSHHRRLSRSRSNSRSYTPEHYRSRSRSRSPRRVNNSPPSSSHHHHYHGDERHRRRISRSFSRSPSRGGHSSSRNGTNGSRRLLREELNGHGERNGGGPKIAMVRGVEPNTHHNGPHGIHHPPFGAGNQPPSGPMFREDEFHRGEPGHGGFRNSPPHFNGHPHPPRHDHYGYGGVLPPLDGSHANGNNGMHGPYGPGGYFGGAPPPQSEPSMRRNGGGRRRDESLPGVSLLVRNISPDIRTEDLQHAFGKIGDVRDVYIPRDYHSQQPKGFAFVEFATHEQARDARNEMDNFTMKGRILEVVFAQERRKTPNEMRGRVIDGRENDKGHGPRLGSFERSSSFERHKRREREANR